MARRPDLSRRHHRVVRPGRMGIPRHVRSVRRPTKRLDIDSNHRADAVQGGEPLTGSNRRPPPCERGGHRLCFRTCEGAASTSETSTAVTGSPPRRALGIEPLRDLYDLRHTYATFALRAGVPVFAVSRFMGTSIAMIDLHYGHLAVDSHQHAVSLLDALALERAVDAGWTSARRPAKPHSDRFPGLAEGARGGWWTFGGRRGSKPSPQADKKGADQQQLREAL